MSLSDVAKTDKKIREAAFNEGSRATCVKSVIPDLLRRDKRVGAIFSRIPVYSLSEITQSTGHLQVDVSNRGDDLRSDQPHLNSSNL